MLYLARYIVELVTPLHCGSGKGSDFDQPIDRDGWGLYRLPGSTLAGIFRAWAAEQRPGSPEEVDRAFGCLPAGQETDEAGLASLIWCRDGRLLDFSGHPAEEILAAGGTTAIPSGPFIRDHVRLDLEKGTAVQGGKFDEEFAPAGTRFALEFHLDGWSGEPPESSREIFLGLCRALVDGGLRFGGKAAEGFGRVKVIDGEVRRFDLRAEKGCLDWLNLSPGPLFAEAEGEPMSLPGPLPMAAQPSFSGQLTIPLVSLGPLLVGGAGMPDDSGQTADLNFYQEPRLDYGAGAIRWERLVPGSSIRGAIRHRVWSIARALAGADQAQQLIDGLFGEVGGDGQTSPGKVFFQDAVLPELKPVLVQHVAIDRFTGGALDGALFDEAPIWRRDLPLTVRLEFKNLQDREAAVFLQALLDLVEGELPLGAGTNRGNGFFRLHGEGGLTERLASVGGQVRRGGRTLSAARTDEAGRWLAELDQALTSLEANGHD